MLKKQNRLAKNSDVKKALERGRAFFNPFFTVKYLRKEFGQPRFTVVVSTKVSKKAVERNRLKRVIREYIRLKIKEFKLGDYTVILKPKAAQVENSALYSLFEKLTEPVRGNKAN